MNKLLFLFTIILLSGCAHTPTPTGDRIVSVSWINPSPTPYHLIQTSLCGKENSITLDELPAYTEKALYFEIDLTRNCRVNLIPVIGSTTLPQQSNWIPSPPLPSPDRRYHLQIRVFPNAPPILKLEPVDMALQRIHAAGRIVQELD